MTQKLALDSRIPTEVLFDTVLYAKEVRKADRDNYKSVRKPVDVSKVKEFLGFTMLMGLVRKPRIQSTELDYKLF